MRRACVAFALTAVVFAAIAAGVLANRGKPPALVGDDPSSAGVLATSSPANDAGAGEEGKGQGWPSEWKSWTFEEDAGQPSGTAAVPEAAASLVREYEGRGDCVLVRSGYLDLSGKVWSMVVEGSGWVDVCIVQSTNDGKSESKVMHMDAAEWAASLGELGHGG
ncbi:MAG: hypothetical protein LKI67_04520 [Olsenella sp.]|nr:hypothetical protein [Olsenella sp.]MCI1645201.1 hypothetical protein [Olsenella sp.]MCI1792921.1 hypothetical protein [Olsenella sp.]MCI1811104.1 hypothetical protein [Olsenella sp.]MCI1878686.1 hypothetical protein [Olsenella sp.]